MHGEGAALAEREGGGARVDAGAGLLGLGGAYRRARPDRVPRPAGSGDANGERLAGRLSFRRESHSRELVELLSRRLLVLRGALRGLAAGRAERRRVSLRPGHGDDLPPVRHSRELSEMYIGWAAGRGMQAARRGRRDGARVLESSGLGAYTLLRRENGVHVLETPAGESSFDRATVVVSVAALDPAGRARTARRPAIVRRYRREPSPLVRYASGARTGRIDRVLAGDFDLLVD